MVYLDFEIPLIKDGYYWYYPLINDHPVVRELVLVTSEGYDQYVHQFSKEGRRRLVVALLSDMTDDQISYKQIKPVRIEEIE
mgnify:CR=1 FL=1